MDKKIDAGEEKHEQPGQSDDGVLLNRVEGDCKDDTLHHAHCKRDTVAEGTYYIALVTLLAHQPVPPYLVHLSSGLCACFLYEDANMGHKFTNDAHGCQKHAAVGKK